MLKKLMSVFCVFLLLCGCRPGQSKEAETSIYSILSYRGTPSLCLLSLGEEYSIKTTNSVDTFNHAFEEGRFDIIVAPLNVGINGCLKAGKYKLFSVVVFANLNVVSAYENLNGGTLGACGENMVVGKLMDYIAETDLRGYDYVYYESYDELCMALINGEIDAAVLDEISFNRVNDEDENEYYKIDDLRADYEYHTQYNSLPEYGMFVLNDVTEKDQANLVSFAKKIRSGISTYKNDKTTFNNVLQNADLTTLGFLDYKLVRESYNYCGIDFVFASSIYDEIESVMSICDIEMDESIIIK